MKIHPKKMAGILSIIFSVYTAHSWHDANYLTTRNAYESAVVMIVVIIKQYLT